jgi:hypothetical protein
VLFLNTYLMLHFRGTLIVLIACTLFNANAGGQKVEFNGQAAGWMTVNHSGSTGFQAGVKYIPQLLFDVPVNKKFKIDGELSADANGNYTSQGDSSGYTDGSVNLYRTWLRFSGDRFEVRAGLQKINFGSANMLRPLMWFDRVDPRDPLQLTKGVYGLLGKYYFRNNANIWLWILYGNKKTKGWESVPSNPERPEIGGRFQLPVPRGEFAFTFHNRQALFPDDWQPPLTGPATFTENRCGIDTKLDLGVGIWFEGTVAERAHPDIPDFEKALTLGLDYTFKIGQGLHVMAENMFINTSESLFSSDNKLSLTGISMTLPLSIITKASMIIFYDWKNNGWYNFANLSFTFDKFAINLIGFNNPRSFAIFNYDNRSNMFEGYGGQVMLVYNY